ncbi:hypothetical protein H6F43_06275 [Leptolyngbya sp. FACHB-36]|uniref:helix-turn-helix transcriptional regulator n=1 Tax=Leptolyngbya sp. FACHB-36 TaxID=2692808 RepID=UPI001680D701|nr:LuxR C-terminal-related transcriptional regulator [Leptolyngbya sp. FACHB-36]MBD2019793.1 hypothetical protein [Leptolyngbya sp. FACHB-36]
MTARLLSALSEPATSRFSANSSKAARCASKVADVQPLDGMGRAPSPQPAAVDFVSRCLLEALPQGVIVASRSLSPVFWNSKAKDLCASLSSTDLAFRKLPAPVLDVCYRLLRANSAQSCCVMECDSTIEQTVRITARWLQGNELGGSGLGKGTSTTESSIYDEASPQYILILLENCDERLQEDLRIERKKYDLTDREAEIWMLLRQEYTYQDIAKLLQISLNTVKTHVKNVYAKRRTHIAKDTFWYLD